MTVTLVAAIAANGVIGRDGALPWRLPADLAQVKELTMGHVLVMGRRTYDSIGRPLPGRTTIVVTRQPWWTAPGVQVAHDVESALDAAAAVDDDVFVLGGAEIYAAALPHADRMVLSHVDLEPIGDRRFPAIDWSQWREMSRDRHDGFAVATYVRT
jgi:dihydrofolate reductase